MSPHLVFVTQLVDPHDAVLGSSWRLVKGLAAVFERVTVVGNEVRGVPTLPGDVSVISLGKEKGAGSIARGLRYERALAGVRNADALLAHMCPDYLTAAAPIAKFKRMQTLLWFAHPRDSRRLRLADMMADAVLTSLPGAYPRPGPKVRAIGQAIDVDAIAPEPSAPRAGELRLLALGRTSDSKRFDVAIAGVAKARELGADARLRIVGPATTSHEERVRAALREQIVRSGLEERVTIEGGVAPEQVPHLIAHAHALINTTVDGSADKTVFEAMAAGRPAIVSNPVFRDLLNGLPIELRFTAGDAGSLGARIAAFAAAQVDLEVLGPELRSRVVSGHSLSHWADAVRDMVDELRRQG
ncbi:MAG: hypothetical protein QOE83_2036 [Actinomycetota bacterium]|jgi:glycosyltransferase involved in cell wall biosynthesis|nr:hypothetical protein [Actinomycetota bacterium]